MIHYILQNEVEIPNKKTGIPYKHIGYLENIVTGFLRYCQVTSDKDKAKKFDCKSEAARFMKRNGLHPKRYSVIKVVTQTTDL